MRSKNPPVPHAREPEHTSAQPTETSTPASLHLTPPCYLIRHPAVAVPPGTCYGQSDVGLREPVKTLAANLRAQLPQHFSLLSSPLSRCLQLAEALGKPQLDARLMEIDFGEWEMQAYDAIPRPLIDAWAADPLHFRGHGGESVMQMAERAIQALQDALAKQAQALVIVSHGGPLRAIAGYLQGLPAEEWSRLEFALGELKKLPQTKT